MFYRQPVFKLIGYKITAITDLLRITIQLPNQVSILPLFSLPIVVKTEAIIQYYLNRIQNPRGSTCESNLPMIK